MHEAHRHHQPVATDFRDQLQSRVDAKAQQLESATLGQVLLQLASFGRHFLGYAGVTQQLEQVRYAQGAAQSTDPRHFAVVDRTTGKAVGTLALMRIDPTHGVIEVGNVMFSPLLQQTPASTEAQFLLMAYVFDTLGYRRYEWKCDSLNAPSQRTAARLGFQFEGIFRQAVVYKGRNRDTAWFSIIDTEWPLLREAFEAWLSDDNQDAEGRQRRSLTQMRESLPR